MSRLNQNKLSRLKSEDIAELERIDEVAPKNRAAGDRYPDMSSVNR
ncbi:MAG TPA: hypothetical protein V6C91_05975 [Coleofasciculaceae cyanobacterium]